MSEEKRERERAEAEGDRGREGGHSRSSSGELSLAWLSLFLQTLAAVLTLRSSRRPPSGRVGPSDQLDRSIIR